MEVTTRAVASWKGLARAPIRAVARNPKATATLGGVAVVAGLWAWWALQLWGLPDIGDPFDVAAFESFHVPEDRNAFLHYRFAASMISATRRKFQANKTTQKLDQFQGSWAEANPAWRDFLAQSGEALAALRAGSERPDALYHHPEGLSFRTLLPVTQDLRMLARLAILEGSRLEAEGDMAGAWGWYRVALRASRHTGRHGFQIERLVGAAIHDEASKALTRWAADPRVDAPTLRRALDEVIAIDAMTVPRSETLKLEYLLFLHELDDPHLIEDVLVSKISPEDPNDWCQDLPVSDATKKPIQAARVLLSSDRERSLRVARLMTANWLAQVDKPPSRRAGLARKDPPIYEADPSVPPSPRALPPEKLSKWLDSSLLAIRYFRGLNRYAPSIDRERARQARLVFRLASELYRREHGQPPPTPGALVGPYLKDLPEGFDSVEEPVKVGP
jgi:hypothetical protein